MQESIKPNLEQSKPPILVTSPAALEELAARLQQSPRIAVDTESNSLFAYRERVCLIQFSIPDDDFLVDPLALDDLSPLGPVFAAPEIEKVFHAAENDLAVLQRDFGFSCQNLFDTMWAGRILGWPAVGLGRLMEQYFGVPPNKKYQRYNWGTRPLDPKAISYARTDTQYLLRLRDLQAAELQARGRWEEAQEIFAYLSQHVSLLTEANSEATFWRIKGMHDLNLVEKKRLYQLHLWRERMAERLDRPPVKVASDAQLVQLAQVQPHTLEELSTAGLSPGQLRRFGRELLSVLNGRADSLPRFPGEEERPPEAVLERYQTLRSWRREVALCRGVDSDVILPNATLWALAWNPPQRSEDLLHIPGIGQWRQKTYGADLLGLLHGAEVSPCRQDAIQAAQLQKEDRP